MKHRFEININVGIKVSEKCEKNNVVFVPIPEIIYTCARTATRIQTNPVWHKIDNIIIYNE